MKTVGEITDIVAGGVDTLSLILKAIDVASLANTLDKDSNVFKLLGLGQETEDEIVAASDAAEEVMSVEAFATRGKLGFSIAKAQDTALQCAPSSFGGFAMDTSKLGSAISSVARRSLKPRNSLGTDITEAMLRMKDSPSMQFLEARAPAASRCVFHVVVSSDSIE
jgi:hypothetical protein